MVSMLNIHGKNCYIMVFKKNLLLFLNHKVWVQETYYLLYSNICQTIKSNGHAKFRWSAPSNRWYCVGIVAIFRWYSVRMDAKVQWYSVRMDAKVQWYNIDIDDLDRLYSFGMDAKVRCIVSTGIVAKVRCLVPVLSPPKFDGIVSVLSPYYDGIA